MNDAEYLAKVKILTTPELADALDFFSLPGTLLGLKAITGNQKIAGWAWTVRYVPVDPDNPGSVGDYIDHVQPGDVVVIDNAGRQDCTVWGGILSQVAAAKGIAGTIINGVSRDTDEAINAHYPIYACGNYMRTGKDRVQVAAVTDAINMCGVLVNQGDLMVADIDGVVVIGKKHIAQVIDRALEMKEIEDQIVHDALAGMSISAARKKHNYHLLQRNPSL